MPPKKTLAKSAPPKKTIAKAPTAKKVPPKPAVKTPTKIAVKAPAKKVAVKKPDKKIVVTKTAAKPPIKTTAKKTVVAKTKATPAQTPIKAPVKTSTKKIEKNLVTKSLTPAKPTAPIKTQPKKTVPKNMPYEPTDKEDYMNPQMLEFFRKRLVAWRDELLEESSETLHNLHEEGLLQKPDLTDRASEETDRALEFRTRDRERKLINKINSALGRIDDGSYGYCEETGDPIGVKRLLARPVATMTVEAQERHERIERTQRDSNE